VTVKPTRQWRDLSFLKIQTTKPQDEIKYRLHKAQVSFVICGVDHSRWVGYAFVKDDFGSELEDIEDDDFSYEGFHRDPITQGKFDANLPIWDPRAYFLTVLEIWTVQVLKEWTYLVRTVERSINEYVCCEFSLPL
jgi:hypothetical protein